MARSTASGTWLLALTAAQGVSYSAEAPPLTPCATDGLQAASGRPPVVVLQARRAKSDAWVHRCWRWGVHRFQDPSRLWLRCQVHNYSAQQLVTLLADTVSSGIHGYSAAFAATQF